MLPEGYVHQATSENFPQTAKAVVGYSKLDGLYIVQLEEEGRIVQSLGPLTKAQLELVCHAGASVLEG